MQFCIGSNAVQLIAFNLNLQKRYSFRLQVLVEAGEVPNAGDLKEPIRVFEIESDLRGWHESSASSPYLFSVLKPSHLPSVSEEGSKELRDEKCVRLCEAARLPLRGAGFHVCPRH